MKRIDIHYGGDQYSIGGRGLDDLRGEIEAGLVRGAHWLEVNDGEGEMRVAYLLLTPGTPLAIIPIPEELPLGDAEAEWPAGPAAG